MTQLFERTQWQHDYYTTRKNTENSSLGSPTVCPKIHGNGQLIKPPPPLFPPTLPLEDSSLLSNIRDRCQKDFVYKVAVDEEHHRCVHYFYKRENIESFCSYNCPETYIVYLHVIFELRNKTFANYIHGYYVNISNFRQYIQFNDHRRTPLIIYLYNSLTTKLKILYNYIIILT